MNKQEASHPTRVRGLKYLYEAGILGEYVVAPYTGAWIEIGKWSDSKD